VNFLFYFLVRLETFLVHSKTNIVFCFNRFAWHHVMKQFSQKENMMWMFTLSHHGDHKVEMKFPLHLIPIAMLEKGACKIIGKARNVNISSGFLSFIYLKCLFLSKKEVSLSSFVVELGPSLSKPEPFFIQSKPFTLNGKSFKKEVLHIWWGSDWKTVVL